MLVRCLNLARTAFLRISFPVWFQVGVGDKRNLCKFLKGGGEEAAIFNALRVSVGRQLILQLRCVIPDLLVYLVGLEQKPVSPSPSEGPFPLTEVFWV